MQTRIKYRVQKIKLKLKSKHKSKTTGKNDIYLSSLMESSMLINGSSHHFYFPIENASDNFFSMFGLSENSQGK